MAADDATRVNRFHPRGVIATPSCLWAFCGRDKTTERFFFGRQGNGESYAGKLTT
jgi:hypothetical protein